MKQYIELDDVIAIIEARQDVLRRKRLTSALECFYTTGELFELEGAKDDIRSLPAADVVEIVHARWEPVAYITHCSCGKSYPSTKYRCSACKHVAERQPFGLKHCPYCGARMDLEER